jgi:Bax protein
MSDSGNDKPRRGLARLYGWQMRIDERWAAAVVSALVVAITLGSVLARPEPLPDFAAIDEIPARKQAFFEFLAPIVRQENEQVLEQRERLLEILEEASDGRSPDWLDRRWLKRLSAEYDVEWNPEQPLARADVLERRVDFVPVPLALVQAATESGWGRSRFATEANNLFGHWCYERGCGLVPARRNDDAAHEVAAFDSVRQSVSRYLHNLNTHAAYRPLRAIRARLRAAGRRPTAMALAEGLERYSERREAYVEEIKTVIRINQPILERIGASM